MVVIDASILVPVLAARWTEARWRAADSGKEWYAVPHFHAEVMSGLRGLLLGGKLDRERAERAVAALIATSVTLIATPALLPRMWELRHNLSPYDAAYVAAAEFLGCPLVTADARDRKSTRLNSSH